MNLVKHESKITPAPTGRGAGRKGAKRKRGGAVVPPSKKRKTQIISDEENEELTTNVKAAEDGQDEMFVQPALVTGGKLRGFQLEGVAWMVTLWKNGISGILGTFST